jgi:hypothetical protein
VSGEDAGDVEITVRCPFCAGQASVFVTRGEAAVVHTVPTCRTFDRLSADDYWRAVYAQITAAILQPAPKRGSA